MTLANIGLTHGEALIVHFQAASRARVALNMTPRWRWRKRRLLQQLLTAHCAAADACRSELGGSGPALAEVFATVMKGHQ